MTDLERLAAAKREADAALADAEAAMYAKLVDAKEAYRASPNVRTRAARDAAVAEVQAYRAAQRADRPAGSGGSVGGDAYLSPEQNEG